MLLTTPLRPAGILWGKLIAAMGYIFIVIFAAVPLASLVFVFGGVAIRELGKALFILVLIAVMQGVIGLFMSALFGRTGRATATSYAVAALMLFGPMFASIVAGVMRQGDPPRWLLVPSPISALGSALSPSVNLNNLSSMFWMLGSPVYWIMGGPPISTESIPRPIYHYSIPLYIGLTLLLYMLATRLVRPTRRWRFEWGEILVGVVLLLGLLGLVTLAFASTADRYENFLSGVETSTPAPEPLLIEPIPTMDLLETPLPSDSTPGLVVTPEATPSGFNLSPSRQANALVPGAAP